MSDLAWLVQRVSGSRPAPQQPAKSAAKPSEPARTTYVATRRKSKTTPPSP